MAALARAWRAREYVWRIWIQKRAGRRSRHSRPALTSTSAVRPSILNCSNKSSPPCDLRTALQQWETGRFDRAQFSKIAVFEGVRFAGEVWFEEARFSGDARFDRAQFSQRAVFGGVRFGGPAVFNSAQFDRDTEFSGVQFTEMAWFVEAQFAGMAAFTDAQSSERRV
jgi:hypothetical protein